MEEEKEFLTIEDIRKRVYVIRGQQVMLDSDLADIYGYELKAMNQQVKRNIRRFPEDFMFQLTRDEVEMVKSQFVTSRKSSLFTGQDGGRRKLPYVFTEQGIYMLAAVLKGEMAEQQSIFIMRAFKEMRHYIRRNQQFVTRAEMNLVSARVSVLDYGLPAEQVYHCGASSKDAGKKLCAINKISMVGLIHPVIDKLLMLADKTI